jgi:hypothetical protein
MTLSPPATCLRRTSAHPNLDPHRKTRDRVNFLNIRPACHLPARALAIVA